MAFELPQLDYSHDALEPHIDARTMEIHHGKHHAGYTAKLNAALEGTDKENKSIKELMLTMVKLQLSLLMALQVLRFGYLRVRLWNMTLWLKISF